MFRESLKKRADQIEKARQFFKERSILEVDSPILMKAPPIDTNIEAMEVHVSDAEIHYLHTSPEYALKKLLAKGSGDIFYLGHVFRKNEKGKIHAPEFMMAEWYRTHFSFEEMIEETAAFLFLFLGELPLRLLPYREAFLTHTGLDPFSSSLEAFQREANAPHWDLQSCKDFLLTHKIEPHLGMGELTALIDYPAHEAALAKTVGKGGIEVAERFEIYHQGIELTNGYAELADSSILKRRFSLENQRRVLSQKEPYPLDEEFLSSLNSLPPCCGVSVGFDRAFMLMQKRQSLYHM